MGTLTLLLQVAFRNLLKSKINLIIGGIIFFPSCLVVTGGALLDSMNSSMSRSIIGSLAGHVQVYSDKSKDELALFGNMGGEPDLAAIDSFEPIKAALLKHPNVQTVVPMGTNGALINSGNTVDLTLARLRDLYRKNLAEGETPERRAQLDSLKQHVRHLADLLQAEQETRRVLVRDAARDPAEAAALEKARSDAFWADFEKDPLGSLEFLENQLAPQVADGDLLYIRYVGTDLEAFQKSFDRMQIVDGQAVPPGKRGMLLAKFFYEDNLKLKTARRLDLIKEARDTNHKTIAMDPVLQRLVKENASQTREIIYQLDPLKTKQALSRLQEVLASKETDLSKLLGEFLTVTDENFDARYKQFYEQLAPLLDLYRLKMGDTLTITAFSRTGYVQSVNVPIYGTYQFNGLEKSPAGGLGEPDGPDVLPRAVRLPHRGEEGGDRPAQEEERRRRDQARGCRGRPLRRGHALHAGGRGHPGADQRQGGDHLQRRRPAQRGPAQARLLPAGDRGRHGAERRPHPQGSVQAG